MTNRFDIFICYRREGGFEIAKHIYDMLSKDGYSVCYHMDNGYIMNDYFKKEMWKRIYECKDFIVVLSPSALDITSNPMDWIREELSFAFNQDKHIIPFYYGSSPNDLPNTIPDNISYILERGCILATPDSFADAWIELKNILQSIPKFAKSNENKYHSKTNSMEKGRENDSISKKDNNTCEIKEQSGLYSQKGNNSVEKITAEKLLETYKPHYVDYDVYIIYRRKDRDTARTIAQLLQSVGKSVFFDMEVLSGGDFSKQISTGLESSQSYIVLLSEGCTDKCVHPEDWWTKEVEHAIQSGKKIIPVNIENSFKSDGLNDLPEGVKSLLKIQWMSFYENQSDGFVNNVLSLLDNQTSNEHKKENHDIFLACPREDLKAAEKLSKVIHDNGLSVWRDIDYIYTSDSIADLIINAISSSKVFIAIYSSWALKSEWFKKELEFAHKKKIPIIKVLTDTPEGLSGTRRMTFGSLLEMGSVRFEEKLLSSILNNGCKPVTSELASYGKELYDKAIRTNNLQEESTSFSILMRAAELGDSEALSYIESRLWNIDLRDAVSQYVPINSYFIEDLRADLYNRGEILAEDETVSDNTFRGQGMEKAAFRMMKRAIDLGFDGSDPMQYYWCFLTDKDYDECLNQLGASSRIHKSSTKPKSKQIFSSHNENVSQNHDNIEKVQSQSVIQKKQNDEKVTADKLLEEYTPHHVDFDIFISYRRDDAREHARNVQLALRSNGYGKVFFDYDSIQDGEFTKRIINAIFSCTDFLLLLSPKSMERCINQGDPVAYEIRAAKKYNKHIIPMQLNGKDVLWPKEFPADLEFIKEIHWHDHMTNSYFDESIKKLILRLKTRKRTDDNSHNIAKDTIDDAGLEKHEESFEDSVELQLAWIDYNDGNFKEALRSFLLEAKKGSANALNAIGIYYYEGKACSHNYQQAMSYFQKAANLGYASAMRNLGDCYRWGHGVRQDVEKAIYWYKKAAKKKNLKAIYFLAQCYRDISPIEADQYYLEAAHMGHEDAIKYVESHGLAKKEDDIKWNSGIESILSGGKRDAQNDADE